jgi:hypothetical protein
MILIAFFCCKNILLMFVWEVQVYMLVQYSRCEWKKLVYNALSALGVSVCFTLLMKKIDLESLLRRALVLALKFICSSKLMPRSLNDLRLGLAWELWIRSLSKIRFGLKGVLGIFESSVSVTFLSTFLGGTWNIMYLVLLMLRVIRLLWNQMAIFLISVLTLAISLCKSESESSPVVSSA